ncbi:MAG: AAA family ATPase [Cytophagales bacterium]
MIKTLKINNFKTIKELVLADCRRINLFIGKPNAGKSNIIEALTLPSLSFYMKENIGLVAENKAKINIQNLFRVDEVRDLFFEGNIENKISIALYGANFEYALSYLKNENIFELQSYDGSFDRFDKFFTPKNEAGAVGTPVDMFVFKSQVEPESTGFNLLMSPFGNNLGEVLYYHRDLLLLAKDFLKDTNSNIVIDEKTFTLKNQIQLEEGVIRSLPYESLADTFRRILFYVTVARHSLAPIIVLEEPEAHAYPPYVSFLADELIAQTQKQFFVVTHSPYLLNNLIENTPKEDLSVFVCGFDFKQKQTTAKRLSNEDLAEFLDYGVDIFFRIDKYLDNHAEYSL